MLGRVNCLSEAVVWKVKLDFCGISWKFHYLCILSAALDKASSDEKRISGQIIRVLSGLS